ncbi:PREDICTED: uncharacterized protein LOC108764483 [Trachymyrmex cornetzi]|uniref:uncharacterized protein LOC108764483 n=1 Tax=Trachymyrmex cornetzi TaxID=471704 RepID=UPI00084F02B9|nr:PREDICTED: uncharacterized protein LOC108764483 [Trachymyrmex cornetzi]
MPLMREDEAVRLPVPEQQEAQLQMPIQPTRANQESGANMTTGFFMTGPEVSRVGMRMPEFTPADPKLWFNIIDRSFQAAGITSETTKFGYALTALGPTYTAEVRDIIMSPSAERPCEALKTELIKRLSLTQEHKTRRLLEHEEIGDRKPSQFLRHLRTLAGNVVGDTVLRIIWLSRLPAYIQPHLVTRTADTVDQLAEIADAIVEATKAPVFHVSEASRASATTGASDPASMEAWMEIKLAQMRLALQQEVSDQIMALRKSIEAITEERPRRGRDRGRGRPRSGSRPRARSRSRGHPESGLCWYHWRFGSNSYKCVQPCSWQPQQGNAEASRADLCVYPRKMVRGPRKRSTYELSAANGSTIYTYGTETLTLNFGLRRALTWRFVIADVARPIIGADFLAHYGLMVDLKNSRLRGGS